MVRIDKDIIIENPVEVVCNYLTDLENLPQWDRYVLEAGKTTNEPVAAGTSFEIVDILIGMRTAT